MSELADDVTSELAKFTDMPEGGGGGGFDTTGGVPDQPAPAGAEPAENAVVKFSIVDTGTDAFKDAFTVSCAPGAVPADAKPYIDSLNGFIATLGKLRTADLATLNKEDAALVNAVVPVRQNTVKGLREDATKFCEGTLGADDAMHDVWLRRGRYEAAKARLENAQFTVDTFPLEPPPAKATDLIVRVNAGGAVDDIPSDKQALYVELENTATVIKACCARMAGKNPERSLSQQDEFLRKLAACGRVGLGGTHPALAQAALTTLKAEFFARNAGVIKQRANDALVKWAFGAAAVLVLPYLMLRWTDQLIGDDTRRHYFEISFFYLRKEFFLLAAGAAIGTWLSFSIRNLDLTFEDLGKFEDEFLGPWVRVAFVVALAGIVGLMFWSGTFSISIGNLKLVPGTGGATAGATTMLVGIFSGLSERALAAAVSSRAAVFIRGVAGTST